MTTEETTLPKLYQLTLTKEEASTLAILAGTGMLHTQRDTAAAALGALGIMMQYEQAMEVIAKLRLLIDTLDKGE